MNSNKPPTGRTTLVSNPEAAALTDTVRRMRTVEIPQMRDKRTVTRRLLDGIRERLAPSPPSSSLADSRG